MEGHDVHRPMTNAKAEVGAVLSAFAFMRLASALGVGRLVDAIGERVVLASGIGIVAISAISQ